MNQLFYDIANGNKFLSQSRINSACAKREHQLDNEVRLRS